MTSLESMPSQSTKKSYLRLASVSLAVIAGLVAGYFVAQNRLAQAGLITAGGQPMTQNPESADSIKVGDIFGSPDEESFRDHAEGVIQPGGVGGEGSHHLERGEDESQWVYLTSSVIDLDNFVTAKVELWGETFQGKKAGWLMDVGRLKVKELHAAEVNNIEPADE